MARTRRAYVRTFGGGTSALPRYTIGSLVQQAPDAEVIHFVRRRRLSSIGITVDRGE